MTSLEQMEQRAVILDGSSSVADRVEELKRIEQHGWNSKLRKIRKSGTPVATSQGFRSLVGPEPPLANQTAISGVTVETALWDAANLTPLQATTFGGVQADQVFKATAWGVMTTAVTGGQTVTVTPRYGTTTGGTALGASVAAPLEAKVFTNTMWGLEAWLHFRSVGSTGTVTCFGKITGLPFVGVAAGTAEGTTVTFGTGSTTATTVNTTSAQGLFIGLTPSLSTQSYTTLGVVWESLN